MTDYWVHPSRLFDGQSLRSDMVLGILDGQVTAVLPIGDLPAGTPVQNIAGLLTPGFVDLQVNGGGGVLFNQSTDAQGIAAIAAAHRRFGTVAIMPTVITDAPEVLMKAGQAALAARHMPDFAGLHIEGPHIAMTRRGTHAARYIRPLEDGTIRMVGDLRAKGIAVMITLAPEAATVDQIAALAGMGAIVSLGHSDADMAQAKAALDAGARAVTHLFNAMSQMQGRAPGLTGAAINSAAHVGIICDGQHVSDAMIALAIRARPVPDRMFAVSDAMPTVGGPDHFTLYGATIRLKAGRLVNAEGNLAGAHTTLADAVARLAGPVGLPLETALRMTVTVPAQLIGADHLHAITGRQTHDIIVLDDALHVSGTLADQGF